MQSANEMDFFFFFISYWTVCFKQYVWKFDRSAGVSLKKKKVYIHIHSPLFYAPNAFLYLKKKQNKIERNLDCVCVVDSQIDRCFVCTCVRCDVCSRLFVVNLGYRVVIM